MTIILKVKRILQSTIVGYKNAKKCKCRKILVTEQIGYQIETRCLLIFFDLLEDDSKWGMC